MEMKKPMSHACSTAVENFKPYKMEKYPQTMYHMNAIKYATAKGTVKKPVAGNKKEGLWTS
jgi:hypothetical protein